MHVDDLPVVPRERREDVLGRPPLHVGEAADSEPTVTDCQPLQRPRRRMTRRDLSATTPTVRFLASSRFRSWTDHQFSPVGIVHL